MTLDASEYSRQVTPRVDTAADKQGHQFAGVLCGALLVVRNRIEEFWRPCQRLS